MAQNGAAFYESEMDPIAQADLDLALIHKRLRSSSNGVGGHSASAAPGISDRARIDNLNRHVMLIRQAQHEIFKEQFKHVMTAKENPMASENSYQDFFSTIEAKEASTNEIFKKMQNLTGFIEDLHVRASKSKP